MFPFPQTLNSGIVFSIDRQMLTAKPFNRDNLTGLEPFNNFSQRIGRGQRPTVTIQQ